jgi:predicted alpha-1,2-mannosidase
MVDPFIGTGGHGHTFPGPTRPFGMVQLSPDTRLDGWDGCSGYHYSDNVIYGFSHTHLSGTGVSDYGDILIMPFRGEVRWNNGADGTPGYGSRFDKDTEKARPGHYEVYLKDPEIRVELTATERVGFHRYTYMSTRDRKLIIDLAHRDKVISSEIRQKDPFTLVGHRRSSAWAADQRVFFDMEFNAPIVSLEIKESKNGAKAVIDFGAGEDVIMVKVGLSPVDIEGAKKNLEAEIPLWNFFDIKKESDAVWEKQLSKIDVEGGTKKMRRIFYTALYHTMIAPNLYTDIDGRYRGMDRKIHKAENFSNYTVFSLWDTYRSTHPLYTLIEQKRTNDFINTFLNQYTQGGRLPVWELAGNETDCMIGYHSVPVIADAYLKGIRGFDAELAMRAMRHSANQSVFGIDEYRKYGYIPADTEAESVSKTLEYAYDNWTIAVMADSMKLAAVADDYYRTSQYYKNVLDPETGFMRARNNNQWFSPFRPDEVNFNYTEANAWQYSFYVPHDIDGWMKMLGGPEQLAAKLDSLFTADSSTTGREQADITGLIGQYAHGNEPSHHIPYLYAFTGQPYKTQRYVRKIMNTLYDDQPEGLSGNEDCGQMSSWLVFSAMGFYPVTPGSGEYIIGAPWFDKVTLNLENGKQFVISAKDQSRRNRYVQSLKLNGANHPYTFLKHSDVIKGGTLDFRLADEPNLEFGTASEHRPSTAVASTIVAIPGVAAGDRAFMESTTVVLNCITPDATIFYSTDNGANWEQYADSLVVSKSLTLLTRAELGDVKSKIGKSTFFKIPEKRTIMLGSEYANHYTGGGDLALIDFINGGIDFRAGGWQGYEGVNLIATIELEKKRSISELGIRFLQDENAWIFMPLEVEFYVSDDGVDFTPVGVVFNNISYKQKGTLKRTFKLETNVKAKFVKVVAQNRGTCPSDHKGAGGKSWIFADEITIK